MVSIRRWSACGSPGVVTRSGTRARASASRMCGRRPAVRPCGLSAIRRGQPSSQTTVAAALVLHRSCGATEDLDSLPDIGPPKLLCSVGGLADQSGVALASRSVESLGNHRETMRFIVPLQEPVWCFGDRGGAETVSSELDAPARGADVVEAGCRVRRP